MPDLLKMSDSKVAKVGTMCTAEEATNEGQENGNSTSTTSLDAAEAVEKSEFCDGDSNSTSSLGLVSPGANITGVENSADLEDVFNESCDGGFAQIVQGPEVETVELPSPIECESDKSTSISLKDFHKVESKGDTASVDLRLSTPEQIIPDKNTKKEDSIELDVEESCVVENAAQRLPHPAGGPKKAWTLDNTPIREASSHILRSASEKEREHPHKRAGQGNQRSKSESCESGNLWNSSSHQPLQNNALQPRFATTPDIGQGHGTPHATYEGKSLKTNASDISQSTETVKETPEQEDGATSFSRRQLPSNHPQPLKNHPGEPVLVTSGEAHVQVPSKANIVEPTAKVNEVYKLGENLAKFNEKKEGDEDEISQRKSLLTKEPEGEEVNIAVKEKSVPEDLATPYISKRQSQKEAEVPKEPSTPAKAREDKPVDLGEELQEAFKAINFDTLQYKLRIHLVQLYEAEEKKDTSIARDRTVLNLIKLRWLQLLCKIVKGVDRNETQKINSSQAALHRASRAFRLLCERDNESVQIPEDRSDLARSAKVVGEEYAREKSLIHSILAYGVSAELYSVAGRGHNDIDEIKMCCEKVKTVIQEFVPVKKGSLRDIAISYLIPQARRMQKLVRNVKNVNPDLAVQQECHCLKYIGLCYLKCEEYELMHEQCKQARLRMKSHFENAKQYKLFSACRHNEAVAKYKSKQYGEAVSIFQKALKDRGKAQDWDSAEEKETETQRTKDGLAEAQRRFKK